MSRAYSFRVGFGIVGLVAGCMGLTSCVSSPTYGTDKTAMEQLADDVGAAVAVGSSDDDKKQIKYNPRPKLVLPPKGEQTALVTPQDSLASSDTNDKWVESPEDTRKRLRAEAAANENNPHYRSPLLDGYGKAGTQTESQKWQAFRDARALQKGAYLDQRRYLSDPPSAYRQSDAANLDDLGTPEEKKAKLRKKQAKSAQQTSSWWQPFQ